jgi:hypothetical protein
MPKMILGKTAKNIQLAFTPNCRNFFDRLAKMPLMEELH